MSKLIIEFANEQLRKEFIAWFTDAGGEDDLVEFLATHNIPFSGIDYSDFFLSKAEPKLVIE